MLPVGDEGTRWPRLARRERKAERWRAEADALRAEREADVNAPPPHHALGEHIARGAEAEWWNDGQRGFLPGIPVLGVVVGLLTYLGLGRRRKRRGRS